MKNKWTAEAPNFTQSIEALGNRSKQAMHQGNTGLNSMSNILSRPDTTKQGISGLGQNTGHGPSHWMGGQSGDLRRGIIATADHLGIDPVDLATVISYETSGTFDPMKKGPTTQWGQHRGLIQFGEPQAQQYGVDWNNPLASQLGPNGAIAKYLLNAGVRPGMAIHDVYSAVNAGRVGRYNASDANNGGAPGTVMDKVNNQMHGHREKAVNLIGYRSQTPQQSISAYGI